MRDSDNPRWRNYYCEECSEPAIYVHMDYFGTKRRFCVDHCHVDLGPNYAGPGTDERIRWSYREEKIRRSLQEQSQ